MDVYPAHNLILIQDILSGFTSPCGPITKFLGILDIVFNPVWDQYPQLIRFGHNFETSGMTFLRL